MTYCRIEKASAAEALFMVTPSSAVDKALMRFEVFWRCLFCARQRQKTSVAGLLCQTEEGKDMYVQELCLR